MGKRKPEEIERRLARLKTINQLIYDDYQQSLDREDDMVYPYEDAIKLLSDDELRTFAEGQNTGIDAEIEDAEVYHKYHNAFLELQDSGSPRRPFDPCKGNDLERIASTLLDLSYVEYEQGSTEYNSIMAKNKATIEELKDPAKRKEMVEKKLRELNSLDLTPVLVGTDAEKIKFCKEHPLEVDAMLLISDMTSYYQSCTTKYGLQIDEGLLLACQEKTKVMQNAGTAGALAEGYSNEFYPFVAGKSANTIHAMSDTLPEWVSQLNGLGEARKATYGEGSAEKEFDLMLTKYTLVGDNKKLYEMFEKQAYEAMAAQGIFSGGPFKYVPFDEDGKQISLEEAANIMYNDGVAKSNKVTFLERTKEELNYLSNGGEKPKYAFTGGKISFNGLNSKGYEAYQKENIETLNNEYKTVLNANPNRIAKTVDFSEEGKDYSKIITDYFNELNRVKEVYDNHLKAVSGDNSVSSDNYMPVIDKISFLENAFLSNLDNKEAREKAQVNFATIKNAIQDFAGFVEPIKQGESVKDFTKETFLNPLSNISDQTMKLGQLADKQSTLPPERVELLKTIVSQVEKLKLKNAPESPEKDMLGIPKVSIIDACSAKFLMPIKFGRQLAYSYTSDNQFPKDPVGYDAFSKLKEQIDSFDKKTSEMFFKKEGASITKDDYINMAKALKNVAENAALFSSDSPNGMKGIGQSVNPVVKYSKDILMEIGDFFKEVPEIVELAKTAESAYAMSCRKEYQKLHKQAFSGDVLKSPEAKTAWEKMTVLKNQYKELDNIYQKDRLAMMVINPAFCTQQVTNAEKMLGRIEKAGSEATVTNDNRMLTADESLSAEKRTKYMAEVRNDCLMIQMFGIGLTNERRTNSKAKATDEEKFIYGNTKLDDISNKETAVKYTYAIQRAESFLKHRKDFYEFEPKRNENLKETTPVLKGTLGLAGYNAGNIELQNKITQIVTHSNDSLNLDYKRLSSIIKKGTAEANALRDQITSYSEKVKTNGAITIDDKLMLFKASKDYLHKKSSIPMTQFGKNRVNAATEILGKVGLDILSDSSNASIFNNVKKEMEIEMLRNPKFRQEMTSWAKEVINKNVDSGKKLSEDNPELLTASELLVFGKAADAAMPNPKKNYVDTKLDSKEKMNMIAEKLASVKADAKTLLSNSLQNGLKGLQQLANGPINNQIEVSEEKEAQPISI